MNPCGSEWRKTYGTYTGTLNLYGPFLVPQVYSMLGTRQYVDERDRKRWLETLGEACEQTGWWIHAYATMGTALGL